MQAMVLPRAGAGALEAREIERPTPAHGQVLVKVRACGVCRTDLHVVDGELPHARVPLVPGHEIVGVIDRMEGARENIEAAGYVFEALFTTQDLGIEPTK